MQVELVNERESERMKETVKGRGIENERERENERDSERERDREWVRERESVKVNTNGDTNFTRKGYLVYYENKRYVLFNYRD